MYALREKMRESDEEDGRAFEKKLRKSSFGQNE